MSRPPASSRTFGRHPWPRILVRARSTWFGVTETASFLGAALAAVARVFLGRWPEPPGVDYLAPRGRDTEPSSPLTSRKAPRRRRRFAADVIHGGSS
jgi:hypothetical protein